MDDFARNKGPRVFIAYSGETAFDYVEELGKHLAWAFDVFYDTKMRAYPWDRQLREAFDGSGAAVALVDTNFLRSQYVSQVEAPQLLARNLRKEIPVLALAVGVVATEVELRKYEVPIDDENFEQHTLSELVWVPRKVQDDGTRNHRAMPLPGLDPIGRGYRYDEVLSVLLDEFDQASSGAAKPPSTPTPPPGSPKTWRERFATISTALLSWERKTVGNWIPRPEFDALFTRLTDGSCTTSTHLLLGSPGSGKSAFLAELGQRLDTRGWTIFALKADELSAKTESSAALTRELELPAEATTLIKALASEDQPCVVLLDQLDTVASVVERHTGRLDVLIELIVALHEHPYVHVVASSRNFEHDHDPRLRSLAARRIELELPDRDTVRTFIHAHSELRFEPEAAIVGLLRTPYNLRLLLEHPDIDVDGVDDPYDLVGLIANRELDPSLRALAGKVASDMGAHEEFFVRVDTEHEQAYGALVRAKSGFFELRDGELRFTHQLVFEYFWARGAVERGLVEVFAKGSQTTFVRPRLRIVLRYLRSLGLDAFYAELDALWAAPTLHQHLRSLIITFITQRTDPTDHDVRWVVNRSREDACRRETLRQLAGPAWFEPLYETIEAVMQREDDEALSVSRILGVAATAYPERVLGLLRRHWLVEARVRPLQFKLRDFGAPSSELIDAWIETTAFAGCDWYMIYGFFSDRPGNEHHAAVVAGNYVAKQVADLARDVAVLDEHYARFSRLRSGLETIMLPPGAELFRGASGQFLRRIWHAMSALVGLVEPRDESHWRSYRITRDDFGRDRSSLPHVIWAACVDLAKTEPGGFAAFARSYGMVDSGTLQGAVCAGIRELAGHEPDLALELLVEEPRRLMLGSSVEHDAPRFPRRIISTAANAAAPEQLERLVAAILALKPSADAAAEIRDRMAEELDRADQAVVMGLLDAIPSDRRPGTALTWLEAHADLPEQLRWWDREPPSHAVRIISSPISQGEFASMEVDEIAGVFDVLKDNTEWHHPDNWEVGGSIEASSELAKALARSPDRAAELFERFEPGKQERPIAYTVREWADAGERELVLNWVRWADARGHVKFRDDFARALAKVAEHGGLDDELCAMLVRWLDEWAEDDQDPQEEAEKWEPTKAVLGAGGFILPQGSFSVVEALLLGFLRRDTPNAARALAAVDSYWRFIARPVRFSAFGLYAMRLLLHYEPAKTVTLVLGRLNRDISPLLSAPSATPLMSLTSSDVNASALYREIAVQIRDSNWPRGRQAYAELATWTALWRGSEWAVTVVETIIRGEQDDEQLLAGVLHVATEHVIEFLGERDSFPIAIDWLIKILPRVPLELGPLWLGPLERARYHDDVAQAAVALLPMFKAVALRPRILAKARTGVFIIANQLVHEASAYVALFIKGFLEHCVEQGQAPHPFGEELDALVSTIAMLQRKPHQRHHALDILDALITLNPYGFDSMMHTLEALD